MLFVAVSAGAVTVDHRLDGFSPSLFKRSSGFLPNRKSLK